ncbi:MAG: undecaprenyl/decaprenyl-phosphate alpha-N-acetylglucosaminyl 1-phosphate transferase, partial [Verrucomicrobiae bacterium]|nr:undecaprenyl/decaprenyl-phosphate alpha-N-acetylglucosaminyl 1-phosphate transferase [Verrucomicrobiae bacterium]
VWTDNAVLAVLMFSIAGACLGFLRYNFNPAHVFLGDAGSLFLGMTLGITSVLTSSKSQVASSFLIALVVLGYPALDTLLAMLQRVLRGKSPFIGDASHIHHKLLQKGLDHRKSVFLLYAVSFLFCLAAIAIAARKNALTAFVLLVIGAVTAYGLWVLGYFKIIGKPSLREDRLTYRMHYHFVEMMKAKILLAGTAGEVIGLVSSLPGELGFSALRVRVKGEKGGPLAEHEYRRNRNQDGNENLSNTPATVHRDNYNYPESGLEVEAWIHETPENRDLVVERRALLAEAVDAANKRLIELRRWETTGSREPRL